MITGCLQKKNGYYYAVLYTRVNNVRKNKWIPLRLPVETTSVKKAQKAFDEVRIQYEKNEEERLLREQEEEKIRKLYHPDALLPFTSYLEKWLLASKPKREFKFSLMVDASECGLGVANEQVMLQGVIDCFVVEEDGITIIDFKTDRSPHPEYYYPQLDAYGKALTRIYNMPVRRKILYFFSTGESFCF